jgi:hypothetical protein
MVSEPSMALISEDTFKASLHVVDLTWRGQSEAHSKLLETRTKTAPGVVMSYTCFAGGNYFMNPLSYHDMYMLMSFLSVDALAGRHMFLNEVVNRGNGDGEVRLYVEIDIKYKDRNDVRTSLQDFMPMFQNIREIVASYFCGADAPPPDLTMLIMARSRVAYNTKRANTKKTAEGVATAAAEPTDNTAESQIAYGFHLIFPNVVLSFEQVRRILFNLQLSPVDMSFCVAHVDDGVISEKQARLRLPYSRKIFPCPYGFCDRCQGADKVTDDSWYQTVARIGPDGVLLPPPFHPRSVEEFMQTSIRPPAMSRRAPFVAPDTAPAVQPYGRRNKDRPWQNPGEGIRGVDVTDERMKRAVCSLLNSLHPSYSSVVPKKLQLKKSGTTYLATAYHAATQHCMHQGRPHTSNRPYFVFNEKTRTVSIRCFSQQCKDMEIKRSVPGQVSTVLWGAPSGSRYLDDECDTVHQRMPSPSPTSGPVMKRMKMSRG